MWEAWLLHAGGYLCLLRVIFQNLLLVHGNISPKVYMNEWRSYKLMLHMCMNCLEGRHDLVLIQWVCIDIGAHSNPRSIHYKHIQIHVKKQFQTKYNKN